jgi:hypothetical protein
MRALNGLAFWTAVLAIAALAVWFSLEPIQFLGMAATAQHLAWRGLANIAPLGAATLAVMFIVPPATRRAQAGKWRKAWTLLALAYGLALGLAYPARWLVWMLTADF